MANKKVLETKTRAFLFGMLAVALAFVLVLGAGCSKKDSDGSGGGKAVKNAKNATPATDFSYDLTEDGEGVVIKGYSGDGGAVVIPAVIDDMPVTEIGARAFQVTNGDNLEIDRKRARITSIVVPDSVKTIGDEAFDWSETGVWERHLTSVTLPKGLAEIPYAMCYGQAELTEIKNIPETAVFVGGKNDEAFESYENKADAQKKMEAWKTEHPNIRIVEESAGGPYPRSAYGMYIDYYTSYIAYRNLSGNNGAFQGCGKLPLPVRKQLQDAGYKGTF
jgi:hypothetical protein